MLQQCPGGCFYPTAAGPINRHRTVIFLHVVSASHMVLCALLQEKASAQITNSKEEYVSLVL